MRRVLAISTLTCLLLLCGATTVLAEVVAKTDRFGQYITTQIIATGSSENPKIWTVRGRGGRHDTALNPDGDLYGDLWPTIAEGPAAPFHPWVLWSRSNGADYDLVWSNWTADGWGPVAWVRPTVSPGDDLDPRVAFDSTGRPFLVWWSEEQGQGTVFLSMFLVTRWMSPFRVSDGQTDARYPELAFRGDGVAEVTYTTPHGPRVQPVGINRPDTITDDIDPYAIICVTPPGSPTPYCLP